MNSLIKSRKLCTPFVSTWRNFASRIEEPIDFGNLQPLVLEEGDFATQARSFNANDLEKFSGAIQDKYAAHKN
jgi:hypothetical protein